MGFAIAYFASFPPSVFFCFMTLQSTNSTLLSFQVDASQPRKQNQGARIFEVIKKLASTGQPFNSNHVREALPDANGNSIAAVFSSASQPRTDRRGLPIPPLIVCRSDLVPERSKGKQPKGRTVKWWQGAGF